MVAVVVVTASMGAGHDGVALELKRRLLDAGCRVRVVDLLELGRPGQGDRLRATYSWMLKRVPVLYDASMRFWAAWPAPMQWLTSLGAAAVERDLEQIVAQESPDVVVSVYNLASQCLGRLRQTGRVAVPVLTYVTDPGAHPYWVHEGVDAHLTVLACTARALGSYGARRASSVGPLVRPEFTRPVDRSSVRERLGLPTESRIAIVSSGSWTCGDPARTVRLLAAEGDVLPVVLCGRNQSLRRQLHAQGGCVPLGWVTAMADLLRAADLLVGSAGGLTCFEALVAGLPVLLVDPLPGHGRINVRALEDAGIAAWARRPADVPRLARMLAGPSATRSEMLARAAAMLTGDPVAEILAHSARSGSETPG